ncbi:MAG: DsbA family protein [Gemmatimonadota bacterium]
MAKKNPGRSPANTPGGPARSGAGPREPTPASGGGGKKTVRSSQKSQKGFYTALGLVAAASAVFIIYQLTKPQAEMAAVDTTTPLPEATGYWLGNRSAPVPVIEFADFECPACANFYALTEPDVRKLVEAGTISFRFFDFPLPMHANTWPASNAAACANEQGKFWEFHDALFNGQDQWNGAATRRPKGVFEGYARNIGLDVGQWEECFDQQKFIRNVQANAREGERRGVGQTPTFIIGNRFVAGSISYDRFKAYVDSALAEVQATPGSPLPTGDTALRKSQ